jgi:hypothetical protein
MAKVTLTFEGESGDELADIVCELAGLLSAQRVVNNTVQIEPKPRGRKAKTVEAAPAATTEPEKAPVADPEPAPTQPEQPPVDTSKPVTEDELREIARTVGRDVMTKRGKPKAIELLNQFGGQNVTQITFDKLPGFIAACRAELG